MGCVVTDTTDVLARLTGDICRKVVGRDNRQIISHVSCYIWPVIVDSIRS